jgi:nicotinamidase-related amidase
VRAPNREKDIVMYGISQKVIDGVIARRGRLHGIDRIDPRRSALIVIDMQNYYLKPGFQAEIAAAREIVPAINHAAQAARLAGMPVVWIQTAADGTDRDWSFRHQMLGPAGAARRMRELAIGSEGFALWPELSPQPSDLKLIKKRYSALIAGSSDLERELRARAIDTILICGTSTNVCCESTARDGMMLNFRVVMLADALAALTPEAHVASLTNCIVYFGDVMNVDEARALVREQEVAP